MKVLFDHQIFTIQKYGGASKYFCELIKRLPREDWDTSTFISNNEYLKNLEGFSYLNFMPSRYFKGKARLMEWINRPYSILKVGQGNYDIFHQTHFTTDYLKVVGKKKMVVTFHDMNHSKFAGMYRNNLSWTPAKFENMQRQSVERADMIVAVSQNTKKDLVNCWNINPDKIQVIYHGIDNARQTNLGDKRIFDFPYVLYVGERYEFKNFHRFTQAFRLVAERFPDLRLVCTGKNFFEDEKKWLTGLALLNKTMHVAADERSMAKLYRDAEMFVYPSIYEGFGMPVLEAMLYNCPVVLSNTSSLPEVAGDAGLYFDPYQLEDIAEKMELVLTSASIREEKISMGNDRVKLFSWEKTAQEHLDLYRNLIDKK